MKRKGSGVGKGHKLGYFAFYAQHFSSCPRLGNAGITNLLASALLATSKLPSALGVFGPSMVVTVGASFMNNWPMTILGLLSIKQVGVDWTSLNRT